MKKRIISAITLLCLLCQTVSVFGMQIPQGTDIELKFSDDFTAVTNGVYVYTDEDTLPVNASSPGYTGNDKWSRYSTNGKVIRTETDGNYAAMMSGAAKENVFMAKTVNLPAKSTSPIAWVSYRVMPNGYKSYFKISDSSNKNPYETAIIENGYIYSQNQALYDVDMYGWIEVLLIIDYNTKQITPIIDGHILPSEGLPEEGSYAAACYYYFYSAFTDSGQYAYYDDFEIYVTYDIPDISCTAETGGSLNKINVNVNTYIPDEYLTAEYIELSGGAVNVEDVSRGDGLFDIEITTGERLDYNSDYTLNMSFTDIFGRDYSGSINLKTRERRIEISDGYSIIKEGQEIGGLETGSITLSKEINNELSEDFSGTMAAAVYSADNTMLSYGEKEFTVSAESESAADVELTIPDDAELDGAFCKMFIIDEPDSMNLTVFDDYDGDIKITHYIDYVNDRLFISCTASDSSCIGMPIMVKLETNDGKYYVGIIEIGDDLSGGTSVKLESNEYNLYVNSPISEEIYTPEPIFYKMAAELDSILEMINNTSISAAQLFDIVKDNDLAKIFGDDIYKYFTDSEKVSICQEVIDSRNLLADKKFTDIISFYDEIYLQAAIKAFNSGISESRLAEICMDKGELLGINTLNAYEYYSEMNKSEREDVCQRIKALKPLSLDEIKTDLAFTVMANRIYNAENNLAVAKILTDLAPEFGNNLTSYTSSVEDYVSKNLRGKNYTTIDSFNSELDRYIKEAGQSKNSSSNQGSASSSGSITNRMYVPASDVKTSDNSSKSAEQDKVFYDLDGVAWAAKAIKELSAKNIISGKSEGYFAPNDNITREEFIKLLVLALDLKSDGSNVSFSDVNENEWYYPYINTAAASGVVKGVTEDEFGIGTEITRQDLCVMVCRAIGEENASDETNFSDSSEIAEYAKSSVALLSNMGVVNGREDGSFDPNGKATRAEAAKIIYTVMESLPAQASAGSTAGSSSDGEKNFYAEFAAVLGFMNNDEESDLITRGEFIDTALKMINTYLFDAENIYKDVPEGHKYSKAITTAKKMSIINDPEGELFMPDQPIELNDAVSILVKILGYTYQAEQDGGYPNGYIITAGKTGLLKGISTSEKYLSRDLAARLVYNASSADIIYEENHYLNDYTHYITESGVNILSAYNKVYTAEGFVTELVYECGDTRGYIIVDNEKIYYDKRQDILGEYVKVYYEDKDGDNQTLIVENDYNKYNRLVFDAEDAEFSNNVYTYYKDSRRKSTVSVPADVKIYYNGKAVTSAEYDAHKETMFLPEEGTIELTGRLGSYEILKITSYTDCFVERVETENEIIYDQYNAENNINYKDLNYVIADRDGEAASISEIFKNTVLSVAMSYDKTTARFVYCYETVRGNVKGIGESEYTIDGKTYKAAKNAEAALKNKIEINQNGAFYLNWRGQIAGFNIYSDGAYSYGFLLNAAEKDEYLDGGLFIRVIDSDGNMNIFETDDYIQLDSKRTSYADALTALQKKINAHDNVIRYSRRSDGIINGIDLSYQKAPNEGEKENSLYSYYQSTESVYIKALSCFGGVAAIDEDTVLFCVPKDRDNAEYSDYFVTDTDYFVNATNYSIRAYKADKDSFIASVVVAELDKKPAFITDSPLLLVNGIAEVLNSDDEVNKEVYGYCNGAEVSYVIDDEFIDSLNIKGGDVLRVVVNNGEVKNAETVWKKEKGYVFGSNPSAVKYRNPLRLMYGAIHSYDGKYIRYLADEDKLETADEADLELYNLTKFKLYVFDEESGKFIKGDESDLKFYKNNPSDYSRVFFRTYYGTSREMIIFNQQ